MTTIIRRRRATQEQCRKSLAEHCIVCGWNNEQCTCQAEHERHERAERLRDERDAYLEDRADGERDEKGWK